MSGILESGDWAAYGAVVVAKATVLLVCAYVASWLLRGRPAAVRHAVWSAAVAGVVALPLLGAAFPSMRVAVPLPGWAAFVEAVAAPGSARSAVAIDASPSPDGSALAVPAGGFPEPARAAGGGVVPAGAPEQGAVRAYDPVAPGQGGRGLPVSGGALLLAVWLAGALAVLSYTLLSMLHVWLLARRARELRDMRVLARAHGIASELGVTWPVEVLEGEPDAMPMTFGVLTDTLLLPASAKSWPTARLEGVLRHELAHIRRRDSLTQLIAEIGCALYWFHPGVWLAARRLRVEREHACDDVVLLAGARASDYARELLEIARTMRAGPALARAALSMAQPSRLRRRLVAVLDDRPRAARLPGTMLVPFGTAALALVMVLAVVTPSVASQAQQPSGSIAADTVPSPPAPPPPPPGLAPPAAAPPSPIGLAPLPGPAPAAPAPPPSGLAPPPAPAPAAPAGVQDAGCWRRFTGDGTVTERDGGSQRVRTIQKTLGDVRLCMRTSGDVELDAANGAIRSLGPGALVVLATREPGRDLHLEITPAREGLEHAWYVDGERRPFDAAAAEWRDAMLDLLHGAGQIASIRGEVASLLGEMAAVLGRRASLRGEIASIRGRESSLRGEMASVRGRMASLRGEIASIHGREAFMRGEIVSIRGRGGLDADARVAAVERRIAEYDAPRRVREVEERIRAYDADGAIRAIEARAAGLDTASLIAAVEARLAALDVEGSVARIEERVRALDADRRVAGLQGRLGPQEQRLRESLRRIR